MYSDLIVKTGGFMQSHFTYDQLTPLEQCIADFMARQELKNKPSKKTRAAESKRQ